ncbi:hypothetical protein OF83DRAFT_1080792 [Amylostereum chailletii]|nr:hypothetical protein OF83DRAFT_1080792 [Amylostereum chailletii]
MDPIFDAINRLVEDAHADEELHNWSKFVDAYSRKASLELATYVAKLVCNAEGREIRRDVPHVVRQDIRHHRDDRDRSKAMGEDSFIKHFGDDRARLAFHLLLNSEGSTSFKSSY